MAIVITTEIKKRIDYLLSELEDLAFIDKQIEEAERVCIRLSDEQGKTLNNFWVDDIEDAKKYLSQSLMKEAKPLEEELLTYGLEIDHIFGVL